MAASDDDARRESERTGPPREPRWPVRRAWIAALDEVVSDGYRRYGDEWPSRPVFRFAVHGELNPHREELLGRTGEEVERLLAARRSSGRLLSAIGATTGAIAVLVAFALLAPISTAAASIVVAFGVLCLAVGGVGLLTGAMGGSWPGLPLAREPRAAYEDLVAALLRLVSPLLREYISARQYVAPSHVRVSGATSLSELVDPSFEVTQTADQLVATLEGMRGASVGLAGPRGAGKSTLIAALVKGRRTLNVSVDLPINVSRIGPPIGTVVSAPVRYRTDDFIAHLFASLCLDVLGFDPDEPNRYRTSLRVVVLLVVGAVLIFAGFVAYDPAHLGFGHVAARHIVAWVLWGLATCAVAAVTYALVSVTSGGETSRARRHLHELRHLDTVSRTASGGLGPASANLQASLGVSSARRALALPDLVRSYKRFVAYLAERRTVIIGIDELDKMESDRDARRFLNDLKTVFGQPNCYYLVSVSEDALSAFERRGMPLRDVFDSSFDAVLRVAPLTPAESALLLRRRVVGFGAGAHLLCHVLSGGLPRDLIRVARDVAGLAGREPTDLADIVWPLTVAHVRAAEDAAITVAVRSLRPDGTQPLLDWLARLPPLADRDPEALRARWQVAGALGDVDARAEPEGRELTLVCAQFATLAYYAAAVIREFDGLTEPVLQAVERIIEPPRPLEEASTDDANSSTDNEGSVADENWSAAGRVSDAANAALERMKTLARARREMMLSPALAWQTIAALSTDPETFPGADGDSDPRHVVRSAPHDGRAGSDHGTDAMAHPGVPEDRERRTSEPTA